MHTLVVQSGEFGAGDRDGVVLLHLLFDLFARRRWGVRAVSLRGGGR